MVSLGIDFFMKQKMYSHAAIILRELINQKVYCLGERGSWWDKLALIIDFHLKKFDDSIQVIFFFLSSSSFFFK